MDLREYYNLPEGTNVTLKYIPSYFETMEKYPAVCPKNMGYAFSHYGGSSIPELDVSNVTNMESMFEYCQNFTYLDLSDWDTSKVTTMKKMFYYCNKLTSLDLSDWDTSNVTDMNDMIYGCNSLTTITGYENWDVSKVTTLNGMFSYCSQLVSIDISKWDTSKVTNMGYMFDGCDKLETLSSIKCDGITGTDSSGAGCFGYQGCATLKNFGGWINLKKSITNYGIHRSPNLTYESCINVLNGLYDFTGNGTKPASNEGKLKVNQTFLNLVGEEISIGTNKGWTITV